ncbi:unnamed protein product, partial [Brassica oleracea]
QFFRTLDFLLQTTQRLSPSCSSSKSPNHTVFVILLFFKVKTCKVTTTYWYPSGRLNIYSKPDLLAFIRHVLIDLWTK